MKNPPWYEPHEDVLGEDRGDTPLLSLDDRDVPMRTLIRELAQNLKTAVLVGNPAPVVARMYERLHAPQPGDLVFEESTAYRSDEDMKVMGFGILLFKRQEWACTLEEHEEAVRTEQEAMAKYMEEGEVYEGWERGTDVAWYIQYGNRPADVCRWVNCSFFVIPFMETFRIPAGTPTETGGIRITRDSLLSSLADSGFQLREEFRNET